MTVTLVSEPCFLTGLRSFIKHVKIRPHIVFLFLANVEQRIAQNSLVLYHKHFLIILYHNFIFCQMWKLGKLQYHLCLISLHQFDQSF